jgi:hypothetical protein
VYLGGLMLLMAWLGPKERRREGSLSRRGELSWLVTAVVINVLRQPCPLLLSGFDVFDSP